MRSTAMCFLMICLMSMPAVARDLYVSPAGSATGDGSKDNPLDLTTALTDPTRTQPGDTVWLSEGKYVGPFVQSPQVAGTKDKPIIFRAIPGQRVTLTAAETDTKVITLMGSHTWLWGVEVTIGGEQPKVRGGAVVFGGGDGVKVINLIVHNNPNRSGIDGWAVGNDQEIYGCLVYLNGIDPGAWAHGIYTQNTDTYNTKVIADCMFFNNYGWGIHGYSQSKAQANFHFEGCVAYGNGLPVGSAAACVNFLLGGYKDAHNITVEQCYTWFPSEFGKTADVSGAVETAIKNQGGSSGRFKRGADFGYTAKNNGDITIRNSVFSGGLNAVEVKNWHKVTFTGNLCYTATGYGLMMSSPQGDNPFIKEKVVSDDTALLEGEPAPTNRKYEPKNSIIDGNTYHADGTNSSRFIHRDGKPYDNIEAWRQATGWDANSKFVTGAPTEPVIVLRPNKYEKDRAHLIVYNWPGSASVNVDMAKLWNAAKGEKFRFVNVEDYWGEPVLTTAHEGKAIELPLAGTYAPQLACYVVFRER